MLPTPQELDRILPANALIYRFVDAGDLITGAIDVVTNSEWPHVEMMSRRRTWIGAHLSGGVAERAYDYCANPKRDRWYALAVSPGGYDLVQDRLEQAIGTKYDLVNIFGLFIHDRSLRDQHKLICSRLTFQVSYPVIPIGNAEYEYGYLITPEMLHFSDVFRGKCIYSYPPISR